MAEELAAYQQSTPGTAQIGYCSDISHGYFNQDKSVCINHIDLFKASLPWLYEVHLKNTDALYGSTFGFEPKNVEKGIVDLAEIRKLIDDNSDLIPVETLHCYLEIGGPKLGRDYSDHELDYQLRASLEYIKEHFMQAAPAKPEKLARAPITIAPPEDKVLISPSMMCVDPLNFESALRQVESLGRRHVAHGYYGRTLCAKCTYGPQRHRIPCAKTKLPIDVHLMVENNDFFVGQLANLPIYQISVHFESCLHLDRTLSRIRENGAKAGLAINPATPLDVIEYALERIDYILIMSVNPGFAGQKLTPASLRKIADCRNFLDTRGYSNIPIQIDGNVSFENIPHMVAAGASNLVAGTSSIFNQQASWKQNMLKIQKFY